MAAISPAGGVNADPPRSLDVVSCSSGPGMPNETVNFLPRYLDTSCHPNGCLCRIGHFKDSSVFVAALSGRAVRSMLLGRSGSGPSYERSSGRLFNQRPSSLALLSFIAQEQVRPHPCFRAFPDLPVFPHRTGRSSANASNLGTIPERGVSIRASIWFRSRVRVSKLPGLRSIDPTIARFSI